MNAFFRKAFLTCSASVAMLLVLAGAGCSSGRQYHPTDGSVPDAQGGGSSNSGGAKAGGAGGKTAGTGGAGGSTGVAGAGGNGATSGGGAGGSGASATGGGGGSKGGTAGTSATGGQGGGPVTKTVTGLACKTDGECDSGHCASGVCCKDACTGSCMACKNALTISLADGTCGPIGSGLKDTNGGCAADTATCGKTGACDGKGQCELRGSTTSCGTASCGGGSYTPAAYCDGKGACSTVTPQDCKGFTCSTAGGCAITCSADTECTGGYCAPMASGATTRSCAPKKSDGGACSADNQCTNGHCVSGICCQSACTTKCYACSNAATGQNDGLCKPVSAGGSSQAMCTTSGGECGQDGTCDGNGGCHLAKQGTSCGTKALACIAGNMSAAAPVCNGAGACASPSSQACGNLACNTTTGACKQTCTGDADCVNGNYYCTGTACVAKKAQGALCGKQSECANGNCSADGHCCDTACTGSCFTCASGTCTADSSNPNTNFACNNACVDMTTDPKNCGACGHDCLGGSCSGGVCQPISLATISDNKIDSMFVADGMLYAAPGNRSYALWQIDTKAAGAAIKVWNESSIPPSCVAAGRMFFPKWDEASQRTLIVTCPVSSCSTAAASLWAGGVEGGTPQRDSRTGEIVWNKLVWAPSGIPAAYKVWRANPDGTNLRQILNYTVQANEENDTSWGTGGPWPGGLFFESQVSGGQTSLYSVTNSGAAQIASGSFARGLGALVASDNLVLFGFGPTYAVPLPGGTKAGSVPPVAYSGYIFSGVMDSSNFYGTLSGTQTDVISKCPAGNCSSPTALFRGQSSPGAFAQDATAIYWSTSTSSSGPDIIWKAAK